MELKTKKCTGCSKEFSTYDGRRKFCDKECRLAVYQLQENGKWYATLRAQVLFKLGGRCVRCGQSDQRILDIDHVYNNGWSERRIKNQCAILHSIIKEDRPYDYQFLCRNCNYLKYQTEVLGN